MGQLIYEKKIIATFDSYAHLAQHMDNHESYHDWMIEQVDSGKFSHITQIPLTVTWWCGSDQIDAMNGDFPPWSPEIEDKPVRAEILVSSELLRSLLDKMDTVSTKLKQAPDHLEVIDL